MNTNITPPKGWLKVSELTMSDDEKRRIYRVISDGNLPCLKSSGGRFAAVFVSEEMARAHVAGKLSSIDENVRNKSEKREEILKLIQSGVYQNFRIADTLAMTAGNVSHHAYELFRLGKIRIESGRYLPALAPVVSEPKQPDPYERFIKSLCVVSGNIMKNQEATGGRIETLIEVQKETNRLMVELLNIWKQ